MVSLDENKDSEVKLNETGNVTGTVNISDLLSPNMKKKSNLLTTKDLFYRSHLHGF